MSDKTTRSDFEQVVILRARTLSRNYAEFPESPACWYDDLEALWGAMHALDKHLDEEFDFRTRRHERDTHDRQYDTPR